MLKNKILLLALSVLSSLGTFAQCSMCRAIAESGRQAGGGWADGLNNGILYLMAFPYLLMGVIGISWYRHKKMQNKPRELPPQV